MDWKILICITTILSIFNVSADAQDIYTRDNSLKDAEVAEELYSNGKYFEAIQFFENATQSRKYSNNTRMIYHLAESYRNTRDYINAEEQYKKVTKDDLNTYPES